MRLKHWFASSQLINYPPDANLSLAIPWIPTATSREITRQQGLVTIDQVIAALMYATRNAPVSSTVYTVPEIRQIGQAPLMLQPA